eukprot:scaffold40821_cov211-Skeletonema_dohrnii-CCMP3373.AAC.1
MASLVIAGAGTSAHTHTDTAPSEGNIVDVDNYDFEKEKVDSGSGIPSDRNLQVAYTFSKFGDGNCRDGNVAKIAQYGRGDPFDFIQYSVANADACRDKCVDCPGQSQITDSNGIIMELRGYGFNPALGGRCYCYVEDGASFDPSVCADSVPGSSGNTGTGKVCSTYGTVGECFQVDSIDGVNSDLECPSNEPSHQPSKMVDMSSNQPSDLPSNFPSNVPSDLPSTS